MKWKANVKLVVDVFMSIGLLFLMGYQFWGDAAHEWAGAGMFLLFIIHHLLNIGWYKTLFRGKYLPVRIIQLIVDLLVWLSMVALMISGILLSNHVFSFLNIHGGLSYARLVHMAASYWGFVLMALHLGMHWGMFKGIAKKTLKLQRPSHARKIVLFALGAGIAVYGAIVFIRRDLLTYLFVRTQFVFLDFGEPIPLFYLDYLAMMGTFIFLADQISVRLRKRGKDKTHPQKQGGSGSQPDKSGARSTI